jgi:hypothetical protein
MATAIETEGPGPSFHPCNDPNLSPEEFLQAVMADQTFSMSIRVQAASGLVWSQYARTVSITPSTSLFIPEPYCHEYLVQCPWLTDPCPIVGKSQSNSSSGEYNCQPQSETPPPINTETPSYPPNLEKFLYTVFYTSPLLRSLLVRENYNSNLQFGNYGRRDSSSMN